MNKNGRSKVVYLVKRQLKLIAMTAVATTLAWAALLAGWFWWFTRSPVEGGARLTVEFQKKTRLNRSDSAPHSRIGSRTNRVKRAKLDKHRRDQGCHFSHHGGKHDIWINP